jgi:hypothetical protein
MCAERLRRKEVSTNKLDYQIPGTRQQGEAEDIIPTIRSRTKLQKQSRMAESTEVNPPPYTLPASEIQNAALNDILASTNTPTRPHYIFVETVMNTTGSLIYIHRNASGRYITHPKYNDSGSSRASYRFAEPLHIATIQDFTTCQDLVNQIMPCVVCPENRGADARFGSFVSVAELEVVWKGGKDESWPTMRISGRGEEHAKRILGMMEQRGWRDLIRVKFILMGK